MNITLISIEKYLDKVKDCVNRGKYRVWRTVENRALEDNFLIDESKVKEIVQSLVPEDFSEILLSTEEKTKGDYLYVFGKETQLLRRDSFKGRSVIFLNSDCNDEKGMCLCVVSFVFVVEEKLDLLKKLLMRNM